jgi:DNA-binding transcriptional LysR family regulator
MTHLASLRYLLALNEHRHFGRAAESCHITQPALSNALKALEEDYGTPIVKRGRTFCGLTPEGERVLQTARRILHEHALLRQDLASTAGQPQGALQIGAVPTAVPIAARFATQLQARHAGIAPVVRSISSREIEEGLENLSLDLGLGFAERLAPAGAGVARFDVLPQYQEHYFLVRRDGQPEPQLRLGPPMRWAEAAALPLCLLTPEMHNRILVDSAFERAGVRVTPVMETNSVLTLVMAVLQGEVASVMPGALVGAVRSMGHLQASALIEPEMLTPLVFATFRQSRPSRVLQAALALAADPGWQQHAQAHSGALA